MNIAIISYYDNCQHGQRIAEALERYTEHTVHRLTGKRTDMECANALGVADVIIVTNDYLPQILDGKFYIILDYLTLPGCGIKVKEDALLISSPCAGYYRRPVSGYEEHSLGFYPLQLYRDNCDVVAPDKPEMIYPGMDNAILPIAWPAEDYDNAWHRSDHIIIGAYQGMGEDRKGVKTYLLPAIEQARGEGIEIELLLTNLCYDMTQEDYIKSISRCDVCFEEITPIGVYGNCGVQQMSLGIPTIVNIDEGAARKTAPFIKDYGKPCIKCHSIDDLVNLFRDINQDKIDLAAISRESREYALDIHSYAAIAKYVEALIAMALDKSRHGLGQRKDKEPIMKLYDKAVKEYIKKTKGNK